MIKTKPYNLPKKIYTKIVFSKRLKKTWWIYLALVLVTIFQLFLVKHTEWFYVIFTIAYPLITFGYLYYWINSSDRKSIFKEVNMSFDEDFLLFIQNDVKSKFPVKNIIKVILKKNYWQVYINKSEFIYIPKHIFYSKNDLDLFSRIIEKTT